VKLSKCIIYTPGTPCAKFVHRPTMSLDNHGEGFKVTQQLTNQAREFLPKRFSSHTFLKESLSQQ